MNIEEKTYSPNKYEKELVEISPDESQIAINLAFVAARNTHLLFFFDVQKNNGDAFRHCLWSTLITKHTSAEWAKKWTDAHEKILSEDDISRLMDEANNSKGIELGKNNKNTDTADLINLCLELVKAGKLQVIEKGKLAPTTLEGFNVPSIFRVIQNKVDELIDFILKYFKESVPSSDEDGNTALHVALLKNYTYGFQKILESGLIDVNKPGNSSESCLMVCARDKSLLSYAKLLLEYGANPNYKDSNYGETALMEAASYNNLEMVRLLLPVCDKHIKSFDGSTAYDCARIEGHHELASLLK